MKNIVVCSLLIFYSVTLCGQETTANKSPSKQNYLQKSKRQRTTAWILLSTGITMIAVAAPGDVSFDILPVLVIGGGASVLGSIPIFIAAGRNKRKAMNISTSLELQRYHNYTMNKAVQFPTLTLNLNF